MSNLLPQAQTALSSKAIASRPISLDFLCSGSPRAEKLKDHASHHAATMNDNTPHPTIGMIRTDTSLRSKSSEAFSTIFQRNIVAFSLTSHHISAIVLAHLAVTWVVWHCDNFEPSERSKICWGKH
jgi:hypothetical protein